MDLKTALSFKRTEPSSPWCHRPTPRPRWRWEFQPQDLCPEDPYVNPTSVRPGENSRTPGKEGLGWRGAGWGCAPEKRGGDLGARGSRASWRMHSSGVKREVRVQAQTAGSRPPPEGLCWDVAASWSNFGSPFPHLQNGNKSGSSQKRQIPVVLGRCVWWECEVWACEEGVC